MSQQYAAAAPRDKGGAPLQDPPAPVLAKATYGSENASASSVISVTHNTVALEVAAVNAPAVLKWIPTTDTTASVISAAGTANFDHVVPAGTYRKFVLPVETFGTASGAGSVVGINRDLGLYQRVAVKSAGVGSVLLTEYGVS